MIPYGRQDIDDADIAAVTAVLQSDYLTQGPAVPRFEAAVANHVGAAYALAMNSATSALHVAYLALGVGPGDRVWTSPITFVATANAVLYCGAEVDFVDVDPVTGNMSVSALEAKLVAAERDGALPKVVAPVHLTGRSCDMAAIADLGRRYGFRIVEDASHAIGGTYGDDHIGACRYSDICIFSFHPVKIVTTGEGGMALTQDTALAERMALLRSHGITRDAGRYRFVDEGGWYYEQVDLGFNYRMTDIQAALGESQVRRLAQFIDRRRVIAARYDERLGGLPFQRPPVVAQSGQGSAWHLYSIRIDGSEDGSLRRQWFDALRARDILVQVHYIPVHHQPWYQDLGFRRGMFPVAERYYASTLSLPMFSALTEDQQDQVVAAVTEIAGGVR